MTFPVPFPHRDYGEATGLRLKVAVTDLAASMVTAQAPDPVQAPLHPVKDESVVGVGVRVATSPWL